MSAQFASALDPYGREAYEQALGIPSGSMLDALPYAVWSEAEQLNALAGGTVTDVYSQEAGKLVNALAENRSQVSQFLVPENNDRFSTMASDQFLERAGQITQANNSLVGMLDTLAASGIEVLNSSDGQFASMLQAASDEDGFNYLLFSAGLDQNQIEMSPRQLRLAIGSGILENNNRYLTEILPETQQFALDGKLHFDPTDSVGGGNQAALDITNALSKGLGDIGQTSFVAGLIPGLSFGQHFDFNNQERMLNNLSDYRLLPGDMKSDLLAQISTGRYDATKDGVFSGFGLFGKLGRTLFGIETAAESASAEAGKKVRLGGISGTKGGNLADALNDKVGRALNASNSLNKFTSGLHDSLKQSLNAGELARFMKIDPDAKIGLTGSAATGKVGNPNKATFGQPINQDQFDLDLFVQSDKLFGQFGGKLKAAPELRQHLVENFPELMQGLKPGKKGLSIKFRPSTDDLPKGSIIFNP
jgi:hypothetical protein